MQRIRVFINEQGTDQLPTDVTELPSIDVDVSPSDSLMETLARARAQAGVSIDITGIMFVSVPDESGARTWAPAPVAIVKADNLLHWLSYGYGWEQVSIEDFYRTHQRGVFVGDPFCLILERTTIGNGGYLPEWEELIHWLTQGIGIGMGRMAFERVRHALKRSSARTQRQEEEADWLREFVEQHRGEWSDRDANPVTFLMVLLRPTEWRSKDLREILDIRPDEAERFLSICGYVYNPATQTHQLTQAARDEHLRAKLVEEYLGRDPAQTPKHPW